MSFKDIEATNHFLSALSGQSPQFTETPLATKMAKYGSRTWTRLADPHTMIEVHEELLNLRGAVAKW